MSKRFAAAASISGERMVCESNTCQFGKCISLIHGRYRSKWAVCVGSQVQQFLDTLLESFLRGNEQRRASIPRRIKQKELRTR